MGVVGGMGDGWRLSTRCWRSVICPWLVPHTRIHIDGTKSANEEWGSFSSDGHAKTEGCRLSLGGDDRYVGRGKPW